MGNPYNSQSISGYNATPPPDDASQTAANQVSWAKHKTKLGDPVKTFSEGINTEVLAAFGKLPWYTTRSISTSDSVVALDERKLLSCTNTITVTLLAAGTAGNGFTTTIFNAGSGVITIDGDGAETINGALTFELSRQYDSVHLFCDGSSWFAVAEKKEIALPQGHLAGLTLSNGTDATNDIDIAAGKCRDDADTANVVLAAAVGKQLDVSWAAGGTPGTPTGGLSSSLTLINDTTYHAIAGNVGGTGEIGFDTSITGANLVTDHSFTNTRCIGSVNRLTAINQVFFQIGDDFMIEATLGFQDTTPAATAETQTLAGVPTGRKVRAKISASLDDATTGASIFGLASSLDVPDVAPSASSHNYVESLGNVTTLRSSSTLDIWTNTSAQIRTRHSAAPGGVTLDMSVHGWMDRRGQDG